MVYTFDRPYLRPGAAEHCDGDCRFRLDAFTLLTIANSAPGLMENAAIRAANVNTSTSPAIARVQEKPVFVSADAPVAPAAAVTAPETARTTQPIFIITGRFSRHLICLEVTCTTMMESRPGTTDSLFLGQLKSLVPCP